MCWRESRVCTSSCRFLWLFEWEDKPDVSWWEAPCWSQLINEKSPRVGQERHQVHVGHTKHVYHGAKLSQKKGKDNFKTLVHDCLSMEDGNCKGSLNKTMIWKFLHWVRHYFLAYFNLEHNTEDELNQNGLKEVNIERIKEEFKTHWSAIDFDEEFINCVIQSHWKETSQALCPWEHDEVWFSRCSSKWYLKAHFS